jgi:hypothetical protein
VLSGTTVPGIAALVHFIKIFGPYVNSPPTLRTSRFRFGESLN